jgi:hypothetical protein
VLPSLVEGIKQQLARARISLSPGGKKNQNENVYLSILPFLHCRDCSPNEIRSIRSWACDYEWAVCAGETAAVVVEMDVNKDEYGYKVKTVLIHTRPEMNGEW